MKTQTKPLWTKPYRRDRDYRPLDAEILVAMKSRGIKLNSIDPRNPPGLVMALMGLVMAQQGIRDIIDKRPETDGHPTDCHCYTCDVRDETDGMRWMLRHMRSILDCNILGTFGFLDDKDFRFPDIAELLRLFPGSVAEKFKFRRQAVVA